MFVAWNALGQIIQSLFGGGNSSSGGSAFYNAADGMTHYGGIDGSTDLQNGMEILYGDVGKEAAESIEEEFSQAERKPRGTGYVVPEDIDINPTIDDSLSINDASVYSNVQGSSVVEKLNWLIKNDPNNSQGWLETLLGIQANNEAIADAREYDKMMADTRVQRTIKDLEAAGINPILASNYLAGASGSVGAAGVPDFSVSTNATSRYNTRLNNEVANNKTLAGIVSALIAAVGLAAKGFISKR